MKTKTTGSLLAGFLAVDTRPTIILVAFGTGGTILFPIITIKEKPIIHTAIPITTGIHTAIHTVTGIHTAIPIGIHTIITVMICGLGKLCRERRPK